ncbi:MAG: TldD/PmbA family protein [Synechococcales bacterium]|nr:TldD/PmbA family protein [Synechococcales bacterium]
MHPLSHSPMTTSIAEQLVDLAMQARSDAAEVYAAQSLSRPVSFEANRLKQLESTQTDGLALRLWKDRRPGLVVAYGPVNPQALVDRALALSALKEPEDIDLTQSHQQVYPTEGQAIAVEALVEMGQQTIDQVRQAYPEVLCAGSWDCEVETTRLINSQGLDLTFEDTTLNGFLEAALIRGEDFLTVYDGQTCRGTLNSDTIAQEVLKRLDWAQESSEAPTGKVPVLFTAKAADLLWGTVQSALNGKQVLEGASPWGDRLSQLILSPLITLWQDPTAGPFSCPFDDEGVTTQPLKFVEAGVLQSFYYDRMTGKSLGTSSTGNGFRHGLGSYPIPDLYNFLVQPGEASFEAIVRQIEDGIIVDQALGGGAGISGELSINVDLGYRIQNGQIVGRVKDTMLAGNVYSALKQIIALGRDAEWNGSCWTPSISLEGLSVTGKTCTS